VVLVEHGADNHSSTCHVLVESWMRRMHHGPRLSPSSCRTQSWLRPYTVQTVQVQPSEQTAHAASPAQVAPASIYELGPPTASVLQLSASSKQAKWNDDIGRHVRCESSDPDDRLAPHLACQPPGLRLRLDAPQPYQNLPTTSATTLDAYCVFLLKRPLVRHMLYARYYVAIAQS
jgi:hypothetical protein